MKNPWIERRHVKEQPPLTITVDWGSCPMIEISFTIEYQPMDGVQFQYTPLQKMENEQDARFMSFITASGHTIEMKDALQTYVTVA